MNVFEFDEAIDEMVEENMTKEEQERIEKEAAYAAEQRDKYKTHTFTSATKLYLVLGIIAGVFVCVFESIALFAVTAGWCLLLQIPVLFCLFVVTFIADWVKRRNFTIYLAKKEPDLSLEFIKKHYIVVDANSDFVLFINQEDFDAFAAWKKLQYYDNVYKFEIDYFVE